MLTVSKTNADGTSALQTFHTVDIFYSDWNVNLLEQAYETLKDNIYSALVSQTRMTDYLDVIYATTANGGFDFVFDDLEVKFDEKLALNKTDGLHDIFEFKDIYGDMFENVGLSMDRRYCF